VQGKLLQCLGKAQDPVSCWYYLNCAIGSSATTVSLSENYHLEDLPRSGENECVLVIRLPFACFVSATIRRLALKPLFIYYMEKFEFCSCRISVIPISHEARMELIDFLKNGSSYKILFFNIYLQHYAIW
jgi:hypothetical protein